MGELIRSVRPSDLVRLGLVGGLAAPNQAITLDRLGWPLTKASPRRALWQDGGIARSGHCLRVLVEDGSPVGLAHGRMRSGRQAWEVRHLHLKPEAQGSASGLLEELSTAAGRCGASRVFLRLSADGMLGSSAHRSGFVPAFRETLMYRDEPWGAAEGGRVHGLHPRQAGDDFDLFRLFLACAPAQARSVCGLTLEEWRDSLERPGHPGSEWVFRPMQGSAYAEGKLAAPGWLQTWQRHGTGYLQLLVDPGGSQTDSLIFHALDCLIGKSPVIALVPDFQEAVRSALQRHGFKPVEEYQLFVKSLASRVREVGFVPARV